MKCLSVWIFLVAITQSIHASDADDPSLEENLPVPVPDLNEAYTRLANAYHGEFISPLVDSCLTVPKLLNIHLADADRIVAEHAPRTAKLLKPALDIVPILRVPLRGIVAAVRELIADIIDGESDNLGEILQTLASASYDLIKADIGAVKYLLNSELSNGQELATGMTVLMFGFFTSVHVILCNVQEHLAGLTAVDTQILDLYVSVNTDVLTRVVSIVGGIAQDYTNGLHPLLNIDEDLSVLREFVRTLRDDVGGLLS